MRNFTLAPPLALYIHIPWCIKKCPYCDFNSHTVIEPIDEKRYVRALLDDLTLELPLIWGRQITSVFIGGGTPSLFSPEALDQLLCGLRTLVNLHPETEITLEANPGTFEQGKFNEFYAIGINRLSIGIQSFNDTCLLALGRIHNAKQAQKAVEVAHQAGFKRLNLDLMFALPTQTIADAKKDLTTAIALNPDHISYYQLTIEPNTLFHYKPPELPLEDDLWDMQQQGIDMLDNAGYARYEISAYAQPGQQCRHNINYWSFGDYLGIGAGAHGKITIPADNSIIRRSKHKHPQKYLQTANSAERISTEAIISIEETGIEFMMNALRLKDGVDAAIYQQHTGLPLATIQKQLLQGQSRKILEYSHSRLATTELGFDHLNSVLELFMPDNTSSNRVIPIAIIA